MKFENIQNRIDLSADINLSIIRSGKISLEDAKKILANNISNASYIEIAGLAKAIALSNTLMEIKSTPILLKCST